MLREALPDNLEILYAVKANPNHEILNIMGNLYDGFDVASSGELERVIKAGGRPSDICFAGPGKKLDELRYAIEKQIGCISIESEQEFNHIKALCEQTGKSASVLVRVNPSFDLSMSGMKMGGGAKQFGVDSERVPDLIRAISAEDAVVFKGLHIFAGSQNLNANALVGTFEKILEYALSLATETGIPLSRINMGGGFGIPYFAHERELELDIVGRELEGLIKKYSPLLGFPRLMLELGRFAVGEAGIYLCQILYRKISRGHTFLVIDGGMHHHLSASGNLGQSLARRPMPITVVNRQGKPLEKVHVVGPLCTPLDTFGTVELPQAREGDFIAVFQSGAYGFSASPQLFLSHAPPLEVVVHVSPCVSMANSKFFK